MDFTTVAGVSFDTLFFTIWVVGIAHADWVVEEKTVTFARTHWDTTVLTSLFAYIIPVFVLVRLK